MEKHIELLRLLLIYSLENQTKLLKLYLCYDNIKISYRPKDIRWYINFCLSDKWTNI